MKIVRRRRRIPRLRKRRRHGVRRRRQGVYKPMRSQILTVPKTYGGFPLPPKLRMTFRCWGNFTRPSGAQNGFFQLNSNGLVQPFNNTVGTDNSNLSGRDGTGILSTIYPLAFRNLCANGMYNNYRVLASKCTFTCQPGNQSDTVQICVAPYQTVSSSAYTSISQMMMGPFARNKIATFTNANYQNTVTNYVKTCNAVGVNTRVPQDLVEYVGTLVTNPAALTFWQCWWATTDNTNLTAALGVVMSVEYYTELYNLDEHGFT